LTLPISDRALLILLAAIAALGPITTNLYLPALPSVREHFDASVAEVQATFSVSLVMFAFGILAWGPFSDRYGRRAAVLGGIGIMVAGAVVSLLAQSLDALIAGRALQAFGTAAGLVTARAILSDLYPAERMARTVASLTMVAVMGNALAPLLGGLIAVALGWRAIFGVLVLAAVVSASSAATHCARHRSA
jgi:DHA1 family bicyclomycin/chloramphenicol resistance-like MFS transporter